MRDLWQTRWHWVSFISEYLSVYLSLSFQQCNILIFHSSTIDVVSHHVAALLPMILLDMNTHTYAHMCVHAHRTGIELCPVFGFAVEILVSNVLFVSLYWLENDVQWASKEDRELWEEEQRRLDREWYAIDEGYDDDNNPFANLSEDYTKKKEEQLEQRRKKRMSAQQRQINKVTCSYNVLIV
jgi:hypothetical protein